MNSPVFLNTTKMFHEQQTFWRTSWASRYVTLLYIVLLLRLSNVNVYFLIDPISLTEPWRNPAPTIVLALHRPEGEEDAVSHEHAHAPENGEAEADVAEVLIGPGQEVPGGQLLRGEALRHLVVHDALQALLVEVEGVAQGELPVRLGLRAPPLPHFLLHRASLALNDPWDTTTTWLVDIRSTL